MACYMVYFGDGTYQRTNLPKGKHHPFCAVGISNGGMHSREEAYYFVTKNAYLHWCGVNPDPRVKRPCDRAFRMIPGTYVVGASQATSTSADDDGYKSDDSMPELECVE